MMRTKSKGVPIMRVTIDKDLCTGDQICVDLCPEVFEMDGDTAKVIVDEVPAEFEDVCKEATESCPAECIKMH
jgi:ferredoxin